MIKKIEALPHVTTVVNPYTSPAGAKNINHNQTIAFIPVT